MEFKVNILFGFQYYNVHIILLIKNEKKTTAYCFFLKIIYSHIDHHLITYTLVISTSKIYMNLCQAVSQLKEKTILSYLNYSDYDSTHFDDDRLEVSKKKKQSLSIYQIKLLFKMINFYFQSM